MSAPPPPGSIVEGYADGYRHGAEDVLGGHRIGWPMGKSDYADGYKAAVKAARAVLAAGYIYDRRQNTFLPKGDA